MADYSLCLIGIIFKIVRLILLAYGHYTAIVFLSVVVGCPSALIISSAKSLVSKSVDDSETGKVFSLLSCGETIANLVGSLVFTALYSVTLSFYPGLTFCVDILLMLIMLALLVVVIVDDRRGDKGEGGGGGGGGYEPPYRSVVEGHETAGGDEKENNSEADDLYDREQIVKDLMYSYGSTDHRS